MGVDSPGGRPFDSLSLDSPNEKRPPCGEHSSFGGAGGSRTPVRTANREKAYKRILFKDLSETLRTNKKRSPH